MSDFFPEGDGGRGGWWSYLQRWLKVRGLLVKWTNTTLTTVSAIYNQQCYHRLDLTRALVQCASADTRAAIALELGRNKELLALLEAIRKPLLALRQRLLSWHA